jgi:biotin carboxyl carrier protein
VRAGDIVALLRTGALIQPVTATEDGIVGAPLAVPGTVVGFGTPLMEFTPEGRSTP